ncbi:ABC transporter permease [Rhodococcus sp. 06-156-3C]|uniref:ABC transporter permease n=1 Tax=Nocardiaceae TaxID=85025 RepID=UPI0005230780|nr:MULTISPECIES: ABC transporter permease [Rhodococcus]OZD11017.1 ABC transporter permease [Rhodococcus sp. 06-156-4C]OZD14432.1 ABC transporter permease [Rhodococcus sp. 06-156-4a]OZD24766.1 ABC transporter permease [Rhodococcus sp. 06-156-3C]OZD27740.1 ABC transporter permease [Rhodococcus sp. 06-156-3b]OZD39721.1 ABC transporter permease [Rhodococcus sp. 06-156-3]
MSVAPSTTVDTPKSAHFRRWYAAVPFGVIVVIALVGPWLTPHDDTTVVGAPSTGPSGQFWFGTDTNGMDVFSRVLSATRLDVGVGLVVTVAATTIALIIGLLAGMNEHRRGPGGMLARASARTVDMVQAIPAMVAGLVLLSFFGRTVPTLIIALTIILIPMQARLVRTEVLRVRSEAYIDAARMSGLHEVRILVRHVLPNSASSALENTSAIFGIAIIFCAGLGFLGVGVPPPTPEWGSMLASGATDAAVGRWWSALFPALALGITVAAAAGATKALFSHSD